MSPFEESWKLMLHISESECVNYSFYIMFSVTNIIVPCGRFHFVIKLSGSITRRSCLCWNHRAPMDMILSQLHPPTPRVTSFKTGCILGLVIGLSQKVSTLKSCFPCRAPSSVYRDVLDFVTLRIRGDLYKSQNVSLHNILNYRFI
jgi:hypothetical protein